MLVRALDGGKMPVYRMGGVNVRDWLYVEVHCAIDLTSSRTWPCRECPNVGAQRVEEHRHRESCCAPSRGAVQGAARLRRPPKYPAARGASVSGCIKYVTDRPGHDWRYAIDAANPHRARFSVPRRNPSETGIARTIDWYLANESCWRRVLAANTVNPRWRSGRKSRPPGGADTVEILSARRCCPPNFAVITLLIAGLVALGFAGCGAAGGFRSSSARRSAFS